MEFKTPAGLTFVLVPPGTFRMGSPADEPGHAKGQYDETAFTATLTRPFYLAKHETTVSAGGASFTSKSFQLMGTGFRFPEGSRPRTMLVPPPATPRARTGRGHRGRGGGAAAPARCFGTYARALPTTHQDGTRQGADRDSSAARARRSTFCMGVSGMASTNRIASGSL